MTTTELLVLIGEMAGPQRRNTFVVAAKEAISSASKRIVSTGCYRGIPGDGQSDAILSKLADRLEATYDCVDINPEHIEIAKRALSGSNVTFHNCCSVEYLKNRTEPIDFLYLDSVDFEEACPEKSQIHQRNEAIEAMRLLSSRSIVLLDDVGSEDEKDPPWLRVSNQGKGKLSSKVLLDNGFRCMLKSYQWLFVRQ